LSGRLHVGTSGWGHPQWRGHLYPAGLRSADWLARYAERFDTVEVNTTFYHLPTQASVERWAAAVPPGFVFALKAPKLVTHERRLEGADEDLAAFLDRVAPLAGPVLFQLPPRFPADPGLLGRFLDGLPEGRRFAVEMRDPSWWTEGVLALLERRGVAFCPFDLAGLRPPRHVTAGFVYVRLHGFARRYRGAYPAPVLADWAGWLRERLGEGRDAYVYLDNTIEGDDALRDALALRELVSAAPL
jgi:uncharacterized protein YecE (DUF72 family)